MAAINYCTSESEIDLDTKTLKVPRLFLWYKFDFIYNREDQINKEENNDPALIKYFKFFDFLALKLNNSFNLK
jgi:hypothetical protein